MGNHKAFLLDSADFRRLVEMIELLAPPAPPSPEDHLCFLNLLGLRPGQAQRQPRAARLPRPTPPRSPGITPLASCPRVATSGCAGRPPGGWRQRYSFPALTCRSLAEQVMRSPCKLADGAL